MFTFSQKQFQNLNSIILASLLPKMKINRHTPRDVIFRPIELGGFNIKSIQQMMLLRKLDLFSQIYRSRHPTQRLLTITIQQLQIEWGQGTTVLSTKYPDDCYLTNTWITEIWKECYEANIKIIIPEIIVHPLARNNDSYLMEKFENYFTREELRLINYCRLYLRVTTTSDITNIKGNLFKQNFTQEYIPQKRKNSWPHIPYPPSKEWNLWKTALRWAFHSETGPLPPLGPWKLIKHQIKHNSI